MKKEKVTPEGKKTWSNYYWFYYKWHMAFVLMLIIAIVICSVQCAAKKDPDYYLVFYSDSYTDSQLLEKAANATEKYADDRNEDGEVYIQAINCSYNPNDPSLRLTANQQANAQIQSERAVIWVLDDVGVGQYYEEHGLDIFGKSEALSSHDSHSLLIDDSELSELFNKAGYEEDYYIFYRLRDGADEYNKVGKKIIEALIK